MNIYETLGFSWIIFTATLGHAAILYFAYRQFRDIWRSYKKDSVQFSITTNLNPSFKDFKSALEKARRESQHMQDIRDEYDVVK